MPHSNADEKSVLLLIVRSAHSCVKICPVFKHSPNRTTECSIPTQPCNTPFHQGSVCVSFSGCSECESRGVNSATLTDNAAVKSVCQYTKLNHQTAILCNKRKSGTLRKPELARGAASLNSADAAGGPCTDTQPPWSNSCILHSRDLYVLTALEQIRLLLS